ncbi:glycosylphosphatidylinositol anchor attachment 1 protein-like isoform X1 [Acropora muricata]|uniref:glycosylphosphatidylinositol anchor attachment 1 protein-like isoform X1 n=2 Tax=Acropora muricata TaxID=159855 RepID=UPI0034E4C83C
MLYHPVLRDSLAYFIFSKIVEMGLLSDVDGRKKLVDVLASHCARLCLLSYVAGVVWLCLLSDRSFNGRTYFSENALLPGLVEGEFKNHRFASDFFGKLSTVPEGELSVTASQVIIDKMESIGLHTYHQNFTVHVPLYDMSEPSTITGMNIYGILRAPRIASTEALVITVPYKQGRNKGALALMLSFADHCRKKSYWAKDIIFLVTDKDQLGMQAWLDAYHGLSNPYISSASLEGHSGSIQAALNLEFTREKVSSFHVAIEGINGQLPNLDLVNTVFRLCRKERIPAALHTEGYHENLGTWADSVSSLVTMVMMMFHQASGRPTGNHGLFHRYRIEALTMRESGVTEEYGRGFLTTGGVLEGVVRSLNNLLEPFHQSFFFYLLPESHRYVSIGLYMPPFGCLLLGPAIMAIVLWSSASAGPKSVANIEALQVGEVQGESPENTSDQQQCPGEMRGSGETKTVALDEKIAFLRYPPNIGSIVPLVLGANVAGVFLFFSPDLGYKLGQVTGMDPLQSSHITMASCFAALVLIFSTGRPSSSLPDEVTRRDHSIKKCGALVLFSVVMGAIAVMNFSFAFFVAMFQVPVYLFVYPSASRSRRIVQAFLLLMVSPPMILVHLLLAFNTITSNRDDDFGSVIASTLASANQAVTSSIREARTLGLWSFAMTCLAVLPNWFMFWCLAWD